MDILKSDLFTPHTDPTSGVTSYILTKKVAPIQKNFYYVNNPMDASGRYLWFSCAYPPNLGHTLGVLDMETGDVSQYPETGFTSASPYVEPDTGAVVWGMGASLWRRGPGANDEVELINSLPADLIGSRSISRVATHLTLAADGKSFFIDAAFGLQWVFGTLPIDGGEFELWHRFDRNHNHAQLSPTDPDLVLFAQENHPDPITGLTFRITDRMWLMRKGESPRPVFDNPTVVTHEWWDEDGEHVWCITKGTTWRVNINTQEIEDMNWKTGAWHSHHHPNGKYVVGDTNVVFYRGTPSTVRFLNRETGRDVLIIDNPAREDYVGANYHIDPHPRFVGDGQYVTFTTTIRGEIDVAIVLVDDLVAKTS